MSFLGRRKRKTPPQESDLLGISTAHPNSSNASLRSKTSMSKGIGERLDASQSNLRRRLSSFASLTGIRPKSSFEAGPVRHGKAIGFTASPSKPSRSRSPSPSLSLTIRPPSGLGRRESVCVQDEGWTQEFPRGRASKSVDLEHRISLSLPNLSIIPPDIELLRWEVVSQSDAESEIDVPPPRSFDFSRIPADLLRFVFSYADRSDIASLSRVCSHFLQPARTALYSDLDLRGVEDSSRMDKCLSVMVSNRDLASLVRTFACRAFPDTANYGGGVSSFMMVTFAIALTNMHQLHTLTLPHFAAHLLHHTTFRLKTLTVLSESLTEDEMTQLVSWLPTQPTLVSLSLPNLISHYSPSSITNSPTLIPPDTTDDTTASAIVPHTLPNLSTLHAPTSLVPFLAPGRPVQTLSLSIHTTLYDGLKPSAIMQSIAKSSGPIKHLTICASIKNKIDARTFERVLMSTGAELGSYLEQLDIEWILEDEVLYKLVLAVLPRFKKLHTLRLLRRSPPPPPRSPPPPFPLPSSSDGTPPPSPSWVLLTSKIYAHSPNSSPPGSPLTPMSARSRFTTKRISLDIPLSRAHERTHLAAWKKNCPSLKIVSFLSGAEWKIGAGVGSAVDVPLFTHVGTSPTTLSPGGKI
ncbi:hypothetical protein QCA50_001091 [Cerrena zonata]|uniref:F-box domain-containing protein n=1 Tax=Cerrena zonata TaxID=2478898 RepID=A0AAW0GW66_9APHY